MASTIPKHKKNQKTISDNLTAALGSTASLCIHSIVFAGIFLLRFVGVPLDDIMLILTTAVSLEAIYLSLFIQMTVNRNTQSLADVAEDVEEISEDVEDLGEDVEKISENVEELGEDVDKIEENVQEIQKDVEGVEKDIDEISEDLVELQEDEMEEEAEDKEMKQALDGIHNSMQKLIIEFEHIKKMSETRHQDR